MIDTEPRSIPIAELHLDLDNPRVPLDELRTEEAAMEYLVETADVGELVKSISLSGWLDIEPLIVVEEGGQLVVIEGNRRLAALKIIGDPDLASDLGVRVPQPLNEGAQPEGIRCWVVAHRRDARDYIGFKHINGPFKWDAFAKAKYAADWLDDGDADVRAIAQRLGDSNNTVVRLINGYRVFEQAVSWGFERANIPGRFSFSHLYTALTRPAYRTYLGLADSTDLLPKLPVDDGHRDELWQLMLWLFGQFEVRPVIKSQNPDLKRLAQVLPSTVAQGVLRTTANLDEAYAIVEDRQAAFADALYGLSTSANRVAGLLGSYTPDDELLKISDTLSRTIRSITAAMRAAHDDAASGA